MALQDFIFRTITKAGYTTKGSELSWTELDENFEVLIDELANSNSGAVGNIAPYNPSTTYSNTNPTYVSYLGNIYQYISGTPSAGNTPSTSPTYWQVVSSGVLTHQQNTDTKLAQGTASEVSASALALHLVDQYQTTTLAGLTSLISTNQLKIGYWYYLTDRKIALFATTTNNVSAYGYGLFYNADYANASGQMLVDGTDSVWGDSSSAWWTAITTAYPTTASRIGKKVIYGGKHYESITGLNTAVTPAADTTNWLTLSATHNSYRAEVDMIQYEIGGDRVNMRADRRGNVVYLAYPYYTYDMSEYFQFGNNSVRHNIVNATFFNIPFNRGTIANNVVNGKCQITISDGKGGTIQGCTFTNSELIINNDADILNCTFTNVYGTTIVLSAGEDLDKCSYDTHFTYNVGAPTTLAKLRPNFTSIQRTLLSNSSDNFINLDYDSIHYHENTTGSMTIDYINSNMEYTMQVIRVNGGFDLTINYGTGNILSHDGSATDFLDGTSGHWLVGFLANGSFVVVNVYN